jgi:heme oxygenase
MQKLTAILALSLLLSACGKEEPTQTASVESSKPEAETTEQSDPIAMGVEAMTEAEYRRHIETLASDEFGGRAPASPGEKLTVDYLVRHFRELGLEPANGDSYTQDVPLAWVESPTVTNRSCGPGNRCPRQP